MSAGTGFTLIHNWLNRGGLAHRPPPGGAACADGRAGAGRARQRRRSAHRRRRSTQILVEHQRVHGVRLASGEEIKAGTVVSAADPRRTLLGLVGAPELPPEFVWQTQSIRMRGSVAKVFVQTDGRHGLPDGTIAIAPTLKYLERAYDAAKYGEMSQQPYLEVTTSGAEVAIHFQFAPYALRQGDWAAAAARTRDGAPSTRSSRITRRSRARSAVAAVRHAGRPRAGLGPDRGRPQPRPADPRPDLLHAAAARLVESPHADRRPVPVRLGCTAAAASAGRAGATRRGRS